MASALPRFTGPAEHRQRMRLAAAIGMLAIAALTTGGLATLATSRPLPRRDAESPPATELVGGSLPLTRSSVDMLEDQVVAAERAASVARAAIESARQRGTVDPHELDALERRLEAAARLARTDERKKRPSAPAPDRSAEQPREL